MQVIDRAASLLTHIARDGSASVTGLTRDLSLPPSTVVRILGALSKHGLVEQTRDRRYRLGAHLLVLAAGVCPTRSLVEHARPILQRLAQDTQEDAAMAVLQGDQTVIVDCVYSPQPLKIVEQTSEPVTLNCGFRRLLLAYQPDDWIDGYLNRTQFTAYTQNTVTEKEGIWQNIRDVRVNGYAVSRAENIEGAGGVAAPIFNLDGQVVATVFITVPLSRFGKRRERELTAKVVEAGGQISPAQNSTVALPVAALHGGRKV